MLSFGYCHSYFHEVLDRHAASKGLDYSPDGKQRGLKQQIFWSSKAGMLFPRRRICTTVSSAMNIVSSTCQLEGNIATLKIGLGPLGYLLRYLCT